MNFHSYSIFFAAELLLSGLVPMRAAYGTAQRRGIAAVGLMRRHVGLA